MNHPRAWRAFTNLAGVALAALMLNCGGGGGGSTPAPPPAPVATSLTTSNATPAYGATFTLTPTYSAGTGTLNNGVVCPASGVASAPIPAAWSGARTYTLTVTNTAGVTATKSVVVTPEVVSVGDISPAAITCTVGTATTFSATATGGATSEVTWSSTAGTWAGNVWTAPDVAGAVTITATSVDDSSKTATTTVTVEAVPLPVATSLTASTTTPAYGATFTLTPTYAAGTGSLNNSVACPATGVASAAITANWTGARTYILTVTNALGVTATKSVVVTPQTVAVGAISPAAVSRTAGTQTTFTTTVTGGALNTVTWSSTAGTWVGNVWTAPAAAGNVTITATSNDDSSKIKTTTVTVVAAPVAASLTASTANPAFGATFTLTPNYAAGTGSLDNSVTCPATGVASAAITANWSTGARTYILTVTNALGAIATKSVVVTPQTVAVGAISPAAIIRTVSTDTSFTSTVTGGALNTVAWSSTAGSWVGNVWTAPAAAGSVTITATSNDDPTKTATTTVTVVDAPVATSLITSNPTPAFGETFTLTPNYANGTGVIDNGVTCPATATTVNVTANWSGTRTFTLTVTNAASQSVTAAVDVTPTAVSVGAVSPADPTKTVGTDTTFTSTVTGGHLNTVTWTSTAGTWVGNTWTAPATAGSVTITATSDDDPTKTATTTVTVVDAPAITSFTSAKTTITNGMGTILSYAFTGGTGSIDQSVGAVTTGGTSNVSPADNTATTYTLTVTNAAGETDTETVSITAVAPAHITAFTASATTVTPGTTVTLHPEFEDGTGTLNQSLGTATNNVDVTTAALTATTTFTLTVTNAAGDAVTKDVTVYVVAGTFTGAGSMSTARSAPTATLLADNSVLIVGGTSGGSLASAEVYSAGTYTPTTGSMAAGRYSHAATRLTDGKVLITGGYNSAALPSPEVLATAEVYNPADGSFTPTTGTMNAARMDHTATLLPNGLVLIAGGTNDISIQGAELFDPSTGLFTPLIGANAWPTARTRALHTATLLSDGRVLLAGGYNGPVSGTADIYDPVLNTFTAVAVDMAQVRWGHSATLLSDGKVLITGGREGEVDAGNVLATAEIFDPVANSFSAVGVNMTTAREWHVAALLPNGNVLIAGGDRDEFGAPGDADINLQSAEIYNPVAITFTATGNMTAPRINFTATVIPTTGYVLIVGGGATVVTEMFK